MKKDKTAPDKSPTVHQRNKLKNQLSIKTVELTDNQKKFIDIALNKDTKLMFVYGSAGTAKTYTSILAALNLMSNKSVSDLIYVRSAVESSDHKLGFLPGESNDKMAPYVQPLIDKLDELLPKTDIDVLLKEKRVTGFPVGFLRGLNWNAKVVVADEMQNCTFKELFTLMTRIGQFSKLFLLGDVHQSDINGKSGFKQMIDKFNDQESRDNGIVAFEFTDDDIVRSPLVKYIIKKTKNTGS